MSDLSTFLQKIGAPLAHSGATDAEIQEAEHRLGGRFPDSLHNWYLQADGFDGEAEMCMWRFKPLSRVPLVTDYFPAARQFLIPTNNGTVRHANASHYAIVLDAFINLPFHAVNIRPDSPYFSEVLCAAEENPTDAYVAMISFDLFAKHIAQIPDDPFCFES